MLTRLFSVVPFLAVLLALFLLDAGVSANYAEARSKFGGRSFSRSTPRKAPAQTTQTQKTQKKGGFSRGLAGGLLGGAIGGLLFGSLFGMGGSGMGILPLLILAGVAFYLFRRMKSPQPGSSSPNGFQMPNSNNMFGGMDASQSQPTQDHHIEGGIESLKRLDPDFDSSYFVEVASDVFFKVQAGWMRRDLDSYGHLLGQQLSQEYAKHFSEMKEKGHINKLESIAIRKVELIDGGSDGREDYATVLFTANLLDYTVDEKSGDLIEGSMTTPVKFAEKWTWARPSGTLEWKLEGIQVADDDK